MFAILAVFLAVWGLLTALDPKRWRAWWMATLGRMDINTTREQRRRQEFYLSLGGYVAFSLFLGVSVISGYFVALSLQEQRKARTDYEQAKEKTLKDFDKVKSRKPFKKL